MRTITITFEPGGTFLVAEGKRSSDELCWDEMVAHIVEITHPQIHKPRLRMETSEQREERQRLMNARHQTTVA